MMSRCPKCGWQDARNVQYCPRCGTPVTHGGIQNPAAVNPVSGFSNAYGAVVGCPPRQTGNSYNSNAFSQNYGGAPQFVQPPSPVSTEEQPASQSQTSERIMQQYLGTGKKQAEEQRPAASSDAEEQAAPASSEPDEPAPDSTSSEPVEPAPDPAAAEPDEPAADPASSDPDKPASAFPKPGKRGTSLIPPAGSPSGFSSSTPASSSGSSSSTPASSSGSSSSTPAASFSMPFIPSDSSNKGAQYAISSLDSLWKGEVAVLILVVFVLLIVCIAESEPIMLSIALGVCVLGIPVIRKSYIDAKIKATFYQMANDISALRLSMDLIRNELYNTKKDSEE